MADNRAARVSKRNCANGNISNLTLGSIAAARGRKNVGESVWWLKRWSNGAGAWDPVRWPSRPDNLDVTPDMIGVDSVDGLMPGTKNQTQTNHTVQVNRM